PHPVDHLRRARGPHRRCPPPRRGSPRARHDRGAPVRRQPEGRRGRDRLGVPAAGRARGLRSAAGPSGAHQVAARRICEGRHRRRRHGGRSRPRLPGRAPMSISEYVAGRPPPPRPRRRGGRRRRRGLAEIGMGDGSREGAVVEDVEIERAGEFDSYYGRPVVKAPPWREPIAVYLFLGGVAGGSGLLAFGAQLTSRPALRRSSRLVALGAVGAGTLALIEDLGRPERFLNMMRTVKVTSPMSLGTWILGGFATCSGVLGALEADRMTGRRLPLSGLRRLLDGTEAP